MVDIYWRILPLYGYMYHPIAIVTDIYRTYKCIVRITIFWESRYCFMEPFTNMD